MTPILLVAGNVDMPRILKFVETHHHEDKPVSFVHVTGDEWRMEAIDGPMYAALFALYATADRDGKLLLRACRYPLAPESTYDMPIAALLVREAGHDGPVGVAIETFVDTWLDNDDSRTVAVVMSQHVFDQSPETGGIAYTLWRNRLPADVVFYVARDDGAIEAV